LKSKFANVNDVCDWPILTSVENVRSLQAKLAGMAKQQISCRLSFLLSAATQAKELSPFPSSQLGSNEDESACELAVMQSWLAALNVLPHYHVFCLS
jgi:hypothetical protein